MYPRIRGPDTYGIHSNALRCEFLPRADRDGFHCALARGIVYIFIGATKEGGKRGHVDDRSAFATLAGRHAFRSFLDAKQDAEYIHPKGSLQGRRLQILDSAGIADDPCIVDKTGHSPKCIVARGEQSLNILDLSHVSLNRDRARPGDDLFEALAWLADELGIAPNAPVRVSQGFADDEGFPSGALTSDAVALVVARMLPEGAIVCDESITAGAKFFALSRDAAAHDYLRITGGAIGIGIPLAAGAAVACPDRKVVGLQADGSGMYTVQGLWTQARENLDVVTVVFANRSYAILEGEMRNVGVNHFGRNARRMLTLDEPALDWVSMARGMGVEAGRAETVEDFIRLFDGALRQRGPFLIEAVV